MRKRKSLSSEGGSRQPPAGCCCWKLNKREQISAAGSSNLSAAVPSCVTSRPSLATGASLGVLTPPGPPGRECAADKSLKGKFPLPGSCRHPLASLYTCLCGAGSDPLATTSENQAGWTHCFYQILISHIGSWRILPRDDHLCTPDSSIEEETKGKA